MERSWYSLIDAESGVCCDVILKGIAKSLVTANGFKIYPWHIAMRLVVAKD